MKEPWAQNTLGLDYRAEAEMLGEPVTPIIDVHTHINGGRAAEVWADAAARYGVVQTYSQTVLENATAVRDALGDRVRFIAVPDFMSADKKHAFTEGFLERIRIWHGEHGARMLKFWQAPRLRDLMDDETMAELALDGPWKARAVELAQELGMMVMIHIADPDTWFATKYADASRYGTKAQNYEPFVRLISRYPETQFLAAHMAGSPEDLGFLSGLLERHPNLSIDTSACKWQVRELSKQPDALRAFCERNAGRVLFGTDIVANNTNIDFDLYASRYWALRTLMETGYDGASPIVDPDLHMVDPSVDEKSTAALKGAGIYGDVLRELYFGAAQKILG